MEIRQSKSFGRSVKKFTQKEKTELDRQIRTLSEHPGIGEEKKGDLKGVYVHKFKIGNKRLLLSYRLADGCLELIMIGPHENYYRDLKQYLKNR